MNIRKKVLFNPSNIKSAKADSSDNTTANTKNSAILEESKTFRVTGCHQIARDRSKNYMRSLSREIKKQNFANIQNVGVSGVKKTLVMPSYSTLSNQNLPPLKISIHKRKFVIENDQLPPLTSLKRPVMLSSQNERKLSIFPSTHVSSNKDLFNPNTISRKQFEGHRKIPISRILGSNAEQIERRKQQLNSMNAGSFCASHHSIALSKFSLGSKQSNRNKDSLKNSDILSVERQEKLSKFVPQKQQEHSKLQQVQLAVEKNTLEPMDESIVEEIERNKSVYNSNNGIIDGQEGDNQWNGNNENDETLRSSLCESKTVENCVTKKQKQQSQEESLCESQQIDETELQQKKNTCRVKYSSRKQSQKKQYSFNKDEDFCLVTFKSQEQSSLYQSYQVQTPLKQKKSSTRYLRLN